MVWTRRWLQASPQLPGSTYNIALNTQSVFDEDMPARVSFRMWWSLSGAAYPVGNAATAELWGGGGAPGGYVEGETRIAIPPGSTATYGTFTFRAYYNLNPGASKVPEYPDWGGITLSLYRHIGSQVDSTFRLFELAVPPKADAFSPEAGVYLVPPAVMIAPDDPWPDWYSETVRVVGQAGPAGYGAKPTAAVLFGGGGVGLEADGGDGAAVDYGGKATAGFAAGANGGGANPPIRDFDPSIPAAVPNSANRGAGELLAVDPGVSVNFVPNKGFAADEYLVTTIREATAEVAPPAPTVQAVAKVNVKTVSGQAEIGPLSPRVDIVTRVTREGAIVAALPRPTADITATRLFRATADARVKRPTLTATGTVKVPVRAQVVATLPRPVVSAVALDRIPGHIVAVVPRPTVNANAARVIDGQIDVGPSPPRILATLWIEVHAPGHQTDPWERLPWDRR